MQNKTLDRPDPGGGRLALSCFALLLFLWVTFGGPTPFGRRATASLRPSLEGGHPGPGDRRASRRGLDRQGEEDRLPPAGNVTEAEIEFEPKFAPIPSDTRAILRQQKTLLGESFIELSGGSEDVPPVPDGGELKVGQTEESTQIDEIFQALDDETRTAFQRWMQNSAIAVEGRGSTSTTPSATSGRSPPMRPRFCGSCEQDESLSGSSATPARSSRRSAPATRSWRARSSTRTRPSPPSARATRNSPRRSRSSHQRGDALTLNRLAEFADDTQPLVDNLMPVADDLTPTLQAVERLSNLRRLFVNLGLPRTPPRPACRRCAGRSRSCAPARGPRPVPRQPQPGDPLPQLPEGNGRRLPHQPVARPRRDAGAAPGQPSPRHSLRQISYSPPRASPSSPAASIRTAATATWRRWRSAGSPPPAAASSPTSAATTPARARSGAGRPPPEGPVLRRLDYGSRFGGGRAPNIYGDP